MHIFSAVKKSHFFDRETKALHGRQNPITSHHWSCLPLSYGEMPGVYCSQLILTQVLIYSALVWTMGSSRPDDI